MDRKQLALDALAGPGGPLAGRDDLSLQEAGPGALRLETGDEVCFVKWIPRDDERGRNEIRVSRECLPGMAAPAPRLVHLAESPAGFAACWEWLAGNDLRDRNRELLPRAFELLGALHLRQRRRGAVYSRITRQAHASVAEMIRAELELCCPLFVRGAVLMERCLPRLAPLEQGYATFVHGDVNPGNIMTTVRGLHLVDWGYAHRGLNLLDLDYVRSEPLDDEPGLPWWTIGPDEAGPVLDRYLRAAGLGDVDPLPLQRAVMLLAELRSQTEASRRSDRPGAALSSARFDRLLDPA